MGGRVWQSRLPDKTKNRLHTEQGNSGQRMEQTKGANMSWYSDGEKFDEWEGCDRCNFNKHPSRETCENCKSGDKWNYKEWESEEEE